MVEPVFLTLPALAVEILPRGLVVNKLIVSADGETHDLIVGPSDSTRHGRHPHKYQNTVIGRYANRLPVASHKILRNGVSAIVHPYPNENHRSSLHGGVDGFDVREWMPLDLPAATLFSDKEKASIATLPSFALFALLSPDADQGFPGTLLVQVLFALSPATSTFGHVGSLYVVYRAKLQTENAVTPVNLTQHWGFNLDASLVPKGAPTPTIVDHTLFINADNTLALNEDALSTGSLVPASPHLAHPARLGDILPPAGADKFYVFNTTPIRTSPPTRLPLSTLPTINTVQDIISSPARSNPLVELASPRSGITLAFNSNQPGAQFYTANFFNGEGTRKYIHGWSGAEGDGYGPQTFAFLEFHQPPAAWLHSPMEDDTLITSDELYNSFVSVDVLFKPLKPDRG